jgi:hypothetical protein
MRYQGMGHRAGPPLEKKACALAAIPALTLRRCEPALRSRRTARAQRAARRESKPHPVPAWARRHVYCRPERLNLERREDSADGPSTKPRAFARWRVFVSSR